MLDTLCPVTVFWTMDTVTGSKFKRDFQRMYTARKLLGDLLVANKMITADQLEAALALQRKQFQPLGQILIQQGFIPEERLLQICALQKGVSPWHLQTTPPTPDALKRVPANTCRSYCLLPVQVKDNQLLVLAMRDTNDVDAVDMVRNITKMRIEPVLATEERLLQAIDTAHGTRSLAMGDVSKLVTQAMGEFATAKDAPKTKEGMIQEAEARPVVNLVNQMLTDAVHAHASDIHVEPRKDRLEIRYRIDGQLQQVHELPSSLQPGIIARLKIMASLDIVEYRVPQDGRIGLEMDRRTVDMRVSVLPNYYGQRIVLRILDKSIALRTLPDLGFSEHNRLLFEDMIRKPHGVVLVTGPTGSGKTTTLYAAINALKQKSNNIMTCEDPVEYDLDGINQSQVNEKVGLTFAAQLSAILRQDPDIVLVGEIRDSETAETAIRAALTGHLVLSTLHCNDAPSAIPRLTDMGIEPYLLSTALVGTTAQRLVRILCTHCKEQYAPTPDERALIASYSESDDIPLLFRPTGCVKCSQTGYHGRIGIHEVFPTPHEVQRVIAEHHSVELTREVAAQYGYRPMQMSAIERVLSGHTSLNEVRRVVYLETPTLRTTKPMLLKTA